MKFILWTLVWNGLTLIGDTIEMNSLGGLKKYTEYYGSEVIAIATAVNLFLWIFLYVKFVRTEKK